MKCVCGGGGGAAGGGGGLWKIFAASFVIVKAHKCLADIEAFLIYAIYHLSYKKKITNFDDTKEMAHNLTLQELNHV